MKIEIDCCAKYKKKGKACKRCPLTAMLGKKDRKKLLKKYKKRHLKRVKATIDSAQNAA